MTDSYKERILYQGSSIEVNEVSSGVVTPCSSRTNSINDAFENLNKSLSYAKRDDADINNECLMESKNLEKIHIQVLQRKLREANAQIETLRSQIISQNENKDKPNYVSHDDVLLNPISPGQYENEKVHSCFDLKLSQTNSILNDTVSELSRTKLEVAALKAKLVEQDSGDINVGESINDQNQNEIFPCHFEITQLSQSPQSSQSAPTIKAFKKLKKNNWNENKIQSKNLIDADKYNMLQDENKKLKDKSKIDARRIKTLEEEVNYLESQLKKGGPGSMVIVPPTPIFSPAASHIQTTFPDDESDSVHQIEDDDPSYPVYKNYKKQQISPKRHLVTKIQSLFKTTHLQREHNAQLLNKITNLTGNIQVCCRIRPLQVKEMDVNQGEHKILVEPWSESEVGCLDVQSGMWKSYVFDKVWGPDQGQIQVYQDIEPFAMGVVDGFNSCIIAYGQTGSGKTYTMDGAGEGREPGVGSRVIEKIFQLLEFREKQHNLSKPTSTNHVPINTEHEKIYFSRSSTMDSYREDSNLSFSYKYSIEVSMLEIYNENVYDLLSPMASTASILDKRKRSKSDAFDRKTLEIRRGSDNLMEVVNLTKETVHSIDDVKNVLKRGNLNRSTGDTNMNEYSSRSHMVLHVRVVSSFSNTNQIIGNMFLVDLAGSERLSKNINLDNYERKETLHINKSLSALGDVMRALDCKATHIPYRNSKLTYLLQDALSTGKSRAMMIVCVSPSIHSLDDTAATLQFATNARKISLGKAIPIKNSQKMEEKIKKLHDEKKEWYKSKRKRENQLTFLKKDFKRMEETFFKYQESSSRIVKNKIHSLSLMNKNYTEMTKQYHTEKIAKEEKTFALDQKQQELQKIKNQLSNCIRAKDNLQRRAASLEKELIETKEKVQIMKDTASEANQRFYKAQVELNLQKKAAYHGIKKPQRNKRKK